MWVILKLSTGAWPNTIDEVYILYDISFFSLL